MRGKACGNVRYRHRHGITPAYAGKSLGCLFDRFSFWDYPRVCGEKCMVSSNGCCSSGSPPRMRGKDSRSHFGDVYGGITPAYAGKRKPLPLRTSRRRDHPRVCGEKNGGIFTPMSDRGSPPRMRGKVTSRTRRRTTADRSSGARAATSNAHNGHQPKAIGLAAPHALTQQCPELLCIGHL